MKKILILCMVLALLIPLISQTKKRKLDIKREYIYKKANLLISETDLNCSYFISQKLNIDMEIIGAEGQGYTKIGYSEGDKLYLNKGSQDGLTEGDRLLIIEKGNSIFYPGGLTRIGIYYLKKYIAKITCIYEDRAIITLINGCHPVKVGDLVIPYKEEKIVFKKKIDYQSCRIPQSAVTGTVLITNGTINADKTAAATDDYVTVDLGKAEVKRGDFLLFHKRIKKNLPPLIIGTGIVINAQNNNSTVKILDTSHPVYTGTNVSLLPDAQEEMPTITQDKEDIPIVKTLKKEVTEAQEGEDLIEKNIYFQIDSTVIEEKFKATFDEIKQFIDSKSEIIIVLRGYSCSIGNEEYNLKLSQQRVEKVKEYLVTQLGINANFIETAFYGETESPFDNTAEEQRRKNRSVNIIVRGK